MTDEQYVDPQLVGLYDALNPIGADIDFWVRLSGVAPKWILDIGCGTGLLAIRLAELGHEVTGVDDAAAMLEVARQHDIASVVTWLAPMPDLCGSVAASTSRS